MIGHVPLTQPKLKPPLEDVITPSPDDFWDFRRFLAPEDDWQKRDATLCLRPLWESRARMLLFDGADSEICGQDFGTLVGSH